VDLVVAGGPVWCGAVPVLPFFGFAQLRAHGDVYPCIADIVDGALTVHFGTRRPRGVAPGQTVALYDDTRVVGSATIASATRS
jgi:tRNA-specific 2-thiouridylase